MKSQPIAYVCGCRAYANRNNGLCFRSKRGRSPCRARGVSPQVIVLGELTNVATVAGRVEGICGICPVQRCIAFSARKMAPSDSDVRIRLYRAASPGHGVTLTIVHRTAGGIRGNSSILQGPRAPVMRNAAARRPTQPVPSILNLSTQIRPVFSLLIPIFNQLILYRSGIGEVGRPHGRPKFRSFARVWERLAGGFA